MPPVCMPPVYMHPVCMHAVYMHHVYMDSVRESMKAAAGKIRKDTLGNEYTEKAVVDADISANGFQKKRGFSSLN